MYKVLVVDDEEWIRKGIVNKLKKSMIPFSVIAEASNAQEALVIAKDIYPDIVLCDIRMRNIDGLELSSLITKNYPNTKIIIISGYSEFDYATKAIEIGIVDYLVKPIDQYTLFKALKKCIQQIEEDRRKEEKLKSIDFMEKISELRAKVKDYFNNKAKISEIFSDYIEGDTVFKCIYLFFKEENFKMPVKLLETVLSKTGYDRIGKDLVVFEEKNNEFVLAFCCSRNNLKEVEKLVECNKNFLLEEMEKRMILQYTMGISEFTDDFKTSFYQAHTSMCYRILLEENNIITYEQVSKRIKLLEYNHGLYTSIRNCVLTRNYKRLTEILTDLKVEINRENISYISVQNLYINLLMIASSIGNELNINMENYSISCPANVYLFDTVDEMMDSVKKIYMGLINKADISEFNYKKEMIYEVKEYIDNHYAENNISLEGIAKKFHVSASYLSMLFKEVMNINFQDYVNNVRINNAKILLEQGKFKIKDVAELSGFNNQYYFSLAFKKTVGMSPSEFINRQK